MSEINHRYMGRKRLPHCRTCVCRERHHQSRVKISSPRLQKFRSRYLSPDSSVDLCGRCYRPSRDESRPVKPSRERYRSISPPTKMDRKVHRDHKFAMLEAWFKKFDFDGNGLVDVYELSSLLDYLGVECEQEYVKDLIERADRDRDGMLSFSDFLHMWSEIAQDDIDLNDVVKEHGLYPDLPAPKHHVSKHAKTKATVTRKYEPHHDCSCCESDLKGITVEPVHVQRKLLETEARKIHPRTHFTDDFPILSCHR